MYYLLTFPFYVLFFFFMVYAALEYLPLIMTIVFIGLLAMLFPRSFGRS